MMKRSRKDYTPEMIHVLEEAWNSGMKLAGKKCVDQINDVAASLSISVDSVKEWIGNRNAKARRENGIGKPAFRKPALGAGTNAYSLFAKTVKRGTMDGPSYMKLISEKWSKLDEEGKEEFRKKAQDIRNDPMKGQPRETVIFSQLKLINQACEVLESLGYDVCGMGFDRNQQSAPSLFGSSEGLKFLDMDFQDRFRLFITGKVAVPEVSNSNKNEQKELRQRVRRHFNTSWTNSTNLKSALPYKEIMEGNLSVEVLGLPDGVTFKDPSCYGTNTLKALLGCQIIFKIRNEGVKEDAVIVAVAADIEQTEASTSKSLVQGVRKRNQEEEGKENGRVKKRKLEKKQDIKGAEADDIEQTEASTSKSFVQSTDKESSDELIERIVSEPSTLEIVHDLTEATEENNMKDSPVIPVEIAEDMATILGVEVDEDQAVVSLKEEKTGSRMVDKGKKLKTATGERKGQRKLHAEKRRSKKGSMFEIDYLVDDREGENGHEYLVQWKGFTEEERTWEPVSALPPASLTFYYREKLCKAIIK